MTLAKSRKVDDRDYISDLILVLTGKTALTMSDLMRAMSGFERRKVKKSLYYLKRKKFIAFPARSPLGRILLTKLGVHKLNQKKFDELTIKPEAWDGKWRLLTFDIPEKEYSRRDMFRRKLKELGFFHFQRSVFVLPFDCEKEINLISDFLKITPCVHILVADRFRGDKELVKKFGLN
jgi:phenylacetic acid degradation operon negative regulatory protein